PGVDVMALGDERRGIGRRNEAARRAIGTSNESARRAIGDRITAERRGDQVVEDINRLRRPEPRRSPPLRTLTPVGGVPAAVGRGVYTPPVARGTGGGIASPLTEKTKIVDGQTLPDATWWPNGWTTSD